MGTDLLDSFREHNEMMNERLLAQDNRMIKRIFNLYINAYMDGAPKARTREMPGSIEKNRQLMIGYTGSGVS